MRKKYVIICICAFVMGLLYSCVEPELTMYGTISGVVKNAKTNQPLSGVKATITPGGLSQVTESDGLFMFSELTPDDYTLTFEKKGWLSTTQKVTVYADYVSSVQVMMSENTLGIEATPTLLDFGASTSSLNLTVKTTSGQSVHYTVSSTASWLIVDPQSGTVSSTSEATIRVMVSRGSLASGSYEGQVKIAVNSEYLTIPVYMQVARDVVPTLSVESITQITQTTATVSGLLSLESGVNVTEYGICYSTGSSPTVNDHKASRGSTSSSSSFTCQLSSLSPNTEYHVRAYAICNGKTYYSNAKSFTTSKSDGGSGSGGTEDYSNAKLRSDNDHLTIGMLSCKRLASGRVQMETTILNTGIDAYSDFRLAGVGSSYTYDGKIHTTEIIDDFFSEYNYYSLKMSLNGVEGCSISCSVPKGATKKFVFTISDVPEDATRISVHIAGMFYGYPCVYAYLTYDNVPIY